MVRSRPREPVLAVEEPCRRTPAAWRQRDLRSCAVDAPSRAVRSPDAHRRDRTRPARSVAPDQDPLGLAARARVQTRSGTWLLPYGIPLTGGDGTRVVVIMQPAPASEIAPLVTLAYGLRRP